MTPIEQVNAFVFEAAGVRINFAEEREVTMRIAAFAIGMDRLVQASILRGYL